MSPQYVSVVSGILHTYSDAIKGRYLTRDIRRGIRELLALLNKNHYHIIDRKKSSGNNGLNKEEVNSRSLSGNIYK